MNLSPLTWRSDAPGEAESSREAAGGVPNPIHFIGQDGSRDGLSSASRRRG